MLSWRLDNRLVKKNYYEWSRSKTPTRVKSAQTSRSKQRPNAKMKCVISCYGIFVPRAHHPSGLRQGSRALGWSNAWSPRFTDFPSNLANLIGWEYETNALRMFRKSGPARVLDPCRRPEGSWALGTRMRATFKVAEHSFRAKMPSIERSFYLLNTRSICGIFLYNWTQRIDGFSLLSQRYVRKGNDTKNPAILSVFFVTERTQLNAAHA